MFTTLAETYMTATRMEPMIGRRHPDSIRVALLAAEYEAKKARHAEALRAAERRDRRAARRRLAARMFTGAGAVLSRLGERIAPPAACCP